MVDSAHSKKCLNLRDGRGDRPVLNDFHSRGIWNLSFGRTDVSENLSLFDTSESLLAAKRCAIGLNSLDDTMDGLEVLPNEVTDARVLWNCLEASVSGLISRLRTFDRNVVSERLSPIGNLRWQDVSDVSLKDSGRVGPAHWQNRESKRTERSIERSHVSRIRMQLSLVE